MIFVPVLGLALAITFGFWGFSFDDNFITYRYASNVIDGEGLVFNPGERVLGTSAPGYALLLAGLAALTRPFHIDVPHWGTMISIASIMILFALIARFPATEKHDRNLSDWVPSMIFAALALTSHLNLYLLGSETFAVLALTVLATHFLFVRQRGATAGVLIALAMCCRLDAGLAALVLGLVAWMKQRRFPVAFATVGLTLLGAWLGFLGTYFGHVIPNTLGGKTALHDVPTTLRQWQTLQATLPTVSSVALLAGAAFGLVILWRTGLWRRPSILALGLWVITHEVAYRVIGLWYAPWYHVYLWQSLLALYVLAASDLAHRAPTILRRWTGGNGISTSWMAFAGAIAVLLVPSFLFVVQSWREPPVPRFRLYQQAGSYVREHVDPSSEILAMEIGGFGYFGQRRILDLAGLVSPRFTAAKLAGDRPGLVAELQPAYILAGRADPLMEQVLHHEGIRGRYTEVTRFTEGKALVRLLRRRDLKNRAASGTTK